MQSVMKRVFSVLLVLSLSVGIATAGFAMNHNTEAYAASNSKIKTPVIQSVKSGNSDSGSYLNVTWTKQSTAVKYYIYRAERKNGEYCKIGTTSKTNFKDRYIEYGRYYYYKVKAIADNQKNNSNLSKYKSGKYTAKIKSPVSEESVIVPVETQDNQLHYLSVDTLQEYIPEADLVCGVSLANAPLNGGNLEHYICLTDQFGHLVMDTNSRSGMGVYFNTVRQCQAIVYDRDYNICAYFVGKPVKQDDGTYTVKFNLCSYETEPLIESVSAAFYQQKESFSEEIKVTDFKEKGVKYYYTLYGFTWSGSDSLSDKTLFDGWRTYKYESKFERTNNTRKIATFKEFDPEHNDGSATFCLLLNKEKEIIGYAYSE